MTYPVPMARRNLFHERVRLAITLVGIAFSVVLILVQMGVYLGMMNNTSSIIDHTEADLWVTARHNSNFDFSLPFPEHRENTAKGVEGVLGVKKFILVWSLMKLSGGGSENVEIVGFDPETGIGGPWEMVAGEARDVKYPKGVIVDESSFAKLGKAAVGDDREIYGSRVRVVGICKGAKRITTAPILFTSYKTAQELNPWMAGKTVFLLVKIKPGADVGAVQKRLRTVMNLEDVYTQADFAWATKKYWTLSTGIGLGFGQVDERL